MPDLHYEEVSEATDQAGFCKALVKFANDLDFSIVVAVLAIQHRGPPPSLEYRTIGNIPPGFESVARDPGLARRDPVHQRLMNTSKPLIYDQSFYVRHGAGDLWDAQAPFGYKNGIAVSLHMPGSRRLLLGVDREKPLPKDRRRLNRLLGDVQLLAVHAQDAASRLLPPELCGKTGPKLSGTQLEILRFTLQGKSAWVIGAIIGLKEPTVVYHLNQIVKKLGVANKTQAVIKAVELGLI